MTTEPTDIIQLPDDDEDELPKGAGDEGTTSSTPRSFTRRVPSSRTPRVLPAPMPQEPGGSSQAGAISTALLSTTLPLVSTLPASGLAGQSQVLIPPTVSSTPVSNVFTLHHVPEDQAGASKGAMIQANLMMQHLKEVYEGSKLAYDASIALQANVRVSAIVS